MTGPGGNGPVNQAQTIKCDPNVTAAEYTVCKAAEGNVSCGNRYWNEVPNSMKQQSGERETFVVRILNTQNATWQGTVTWTDGKRTESFRSALELIRLIDSTLLEKEKEPEGGQ